MPRISSAMSRDHATSEGAERSLNVTLEQFKSLPTNNSAAPPDKSPELLSNTYNNKRLALHVSQEVKSAYKVGAGSSNKDYEVNESFSRKKIKAIEARQMDTATRNKIRKTLKTIRAKSRRAFEDKAIFADLPHLKIDAAHCGELARATAKRTLAYGGYAEVWEIEGQDHAFAVIGRPPEQSTVDFKTWKGIWIVDLWAEVTCKAPDYIQAIIKNMKKWARDGRIIVEQVPISPLKSTWIDALEKGKKSQHEFPSEQLKNPWKHYAFSTSETPLAEHETVEPLPPIKKCSRYSHLKTVVTQFIARK